MYRSRADPFLLYRRDENDLSVMVIVQVDDSLIADSQAFLKNDIMESKTFVSEPIQPVNKTGLCSMCSNFSQKRGGELSICQQDKIKG